MVKEKGEHKQKIVVNVSLEGIKIIDERTLVSKKTLVSEIAHIRTESCCYYNIYPCGATQI